MDKEKSEITYQNKDVMSKILAENFKNKSLDGYYSRCLAPCCKASGQ